MNKNAILKEIRVEIHNLQAAESALVAGEAAPTATGTGKPTLVPTKEPSSPKKGNTTKKRTMTPEGRQKISDAQKKRHAERRAKEEPAAVAA